MVESRFSAHSMVEGKLLREVVQTVKNYDKAKQRRIKGCISGSWRRLTHWRGESAATAALQKLLTEWKLRPALNRTGSGREVLENT